MAKAYTSIDIGERALKVAVVQDGAVAKCHVAQLPEGLVAEGRIVSLDATADFIKQTLAGVGGCPKSAAFVVPAADCIVRSITLPLMPVKELKLNLPYEFRDYISEGKDRYIYDYAVLDRHEDQDGEGESLDLMAVASPKQVMADYSAMFRRAGLRLEVALPEQAALQNLIASSAFAEKTCCFMDFGFRATRLYFFDKGKFDVLRTIELGCAGVCRAIATSFDVDERVAADYLVRDFQGAQSCGAALSVYEEVSIEVSRALNFYGFNNPTASVEGILFGGGGSNIALFVNATEQAAGVAMQSAPEALGFGGQDAAFARDVVVAAGAAMKVGC